MQRSVALVAVTLEDAGLLRYDAVSLGNRLLVFRRFMVPSSSGVTECYSNVEDKATAILRNIGEQEMTQTLQTNAYLEGMMVILLVLLTGVDSLLAAPEGSLLLLLELSAAPAAVVAVVLFLRGTGFKFGLAGAVSCASVAVKVRLGRQTCVVSHGWWRVCDRKWKMCLCVRLSSQQSSDAVLNSAYISVDFVRRKNSDGKCTHKFENLLTVLQWLFSVSFGGYKEI